MREENLWLAIQLNKTTTVNLWDGNTKIEFTGDPPMLDRPVFILNDEGERIGAAPEGEHTLESGKVAIIDKNGLLKDIKDKSNKQTTVDLKRNSVPSTYSMFFDSLGNLKTQVRLSLSRNDEKELMKLATMWTRDPKTKEERIRNAIIEARLMKERENILEAAKRFGHV
jgi:hypothetical protein